MVKVTLRTLFRFTTFVVVLGLLHPRGLACSCSEYYTQPGEALHHFSLIFTGTVVAVDVVTLPRIGYTEQNASLVPFQYMERRAIVRLRVSREWKGNGASEYTVLAGAPADPPLAEGLVLVDCQEHLELGREYLVYSTDGYPEASPCAWTGPVERREDKIKALDQYVKTHHRKNQPRRKARAA